MMTLPLRQTFFSIDVAFAEAREAQVQWAATPLRQRLKFIQRARHLIADRCADLAAAAGTSTAEALVAQVLPLIEGCRFLEKNALRILAPQTLGRTGRPLWLRGVESEIVREPLGVVVIIGPSNYPLFLPGVQLLQALVAGNAVLLKPGTGGDAAAAMLREIVGDAGIDERLVGILPSSEAAGREALELPVGKVFFTGSSRVGKEVLARLAARVIPAVVELSGCDAVIIRADADLRLAAKAIAFGLSLNDGATCIAPRRVLVPRRSVERFEAELVDQVQISSAQVKDPLLADAILTSIAAGASWLISGLNASGRLRLPCVLTHVRPGMPVAHLNVFVPTLSLIAVEDDDEAVAIANSCRFALGASVFSRDEAAARVLAARLDAGVVTINDLIVPTADPRIPFGGRKQSGFGVTRGAEGLLEMTRTKAIQLRRGRTRPHLNLHRTSRSADWVEAFIQSVHGRGIVNRFCAAARPLFGP